MTAMIEILSKLAKKKSLTPSEMTEAMEFIVTGLATDTQIEEFLLLLRQKGETAPEIASAAKVMRKHSLKLSKIYPSLLDTCGTGGDGRQTLNVSTLSALTASSLGVPVGKHGNRSVSSTCGSADLLEILEVKIDLPIPAIEQSIEKLGFGFFFAPLFHPAMRYAMPARKKIKGKTLFNILGPLSNPASASYQLIGVYEERLVETLAQVLLELGLKRALVVHGQDGMDEISLCDQTKVAELGLGKIKSYFLLPEDCGLRRCAAAPLQCSSKEACRQAALQVLQGIEGPAHDIVCLNAGAALYIAEKAGTIQEGVLMAKKALRSGATHKKLKEISAFTQSASGVPSS